MRPTEQANIYNCVQTQKNSGEYNMWINYKVMIMYKDAIAIKQFSLFVKGKHIYMLLARYPIMGTLKTIPHLLSMSCDLVDYFQNCFIEDVSSLAAKL